MSHGIFFRLVHHKNMEIKPKGYISSFAPPVLMIFPRHEKEGMCIEKKLDCISMGNGWKKWEEYVDEAN